MWTVELEYEGKTAIKEYRTPSDACAGVIYYKKIYHEDQQKQVLITMKDPQGKWVAKVELDLGNDLGII